MNTQRSPENIVIDEFVAEDYLASLIERGLARRDGAMLWLRDGRIIVLRDAARILGNVSHETDPYGFVGTVDTIASMLRRGFVMNASRAALGRAVYDIEYGYVPQTLRPSRDPDQSGVNPVVR